jgi:hypothetical protein
MFTSEVSFPPVAINFTASNYYPPYNTTSTLNWTATNAASVSISNIGNVANSGTSTVSGGHNLTRTYTLTATGLNGLIYTSSLSITWGASNCPQQWIDYGWC